VSPLLLHVVSADDKNMRRDEMNERLRTLHCARSLSVCAAISRLYDCILYNPSPSTARCTVLSYPHREPANKLELDIYRSKSPHCKSASVPLSYRLIQCTGKSSLGTTRSSFPTAPRRTPLTSFTNDDSSVVWSA
jgi:hypothetical protein